MSTTHDVLRHDISRAALSVALIVCSGLWLVAACEYFATSGLQVDWSATPMFWMLTVVVTPAVCFAGCIMLAELRRRREFTMIEWWALASAFIPVTVGTLLSVWAVRVLFLMSGV